MFDTLMNERAASSDTTRGFLYTKMWKMIARHSVAACTDCYAHYFLRDK